MFFVLHNVPPNFLSNFWGALQKLAYFDQKPAYFKAKVTRNKFNPHENHFQLS